MYCIKLKMLNISSHGCIKDSMKRLNIRPPQCSSLALNSSRVLTRTSSKSVNVWLQSNDHWSRVEFNSRQKKKNRNRNIKECETYFADSVLDRKVCADCDAVFSADTDSNHVFHSSLYAIAVP